MLVLISVDLFWNDTKKYKGVDCTGVIARLKCGLKYPNEQIMKKFCNSIVEDYKRKYNLKVEASAKYKDLSR